MKILTENELEMIEFHIEEAGREFIAWQTGDTLSSIEDVRKHLQEAMKLLPKKSDGG